MTAVDDSVTEEAPAEWGTTNRARRLRILRYVAILVWASVVVYRTATDGFAFNRELLLLYIATGLLAASIGQGRRMLYVIRDWLPFAVVLAAYDLSRGAATLVGRPTMWHWQVDADRWLFFGTVPTVWLQERLKLLHPPWWEVVISTVYMSFFILPYVVAGVLWLRDREEWKRFVRLFVGLSFAALIIYALLPAAPPWAAARCSADDVDGGPSGPGCMFRSAREAVDGGLLGVMQGGRDGAHEWIERIVTRGWGKLNLHTATALIDQGQASVNLVAAIPSLHAGLTAAVAVFLWNRVNRGWRPVLVAYPLIMAFTLVYTAEHYVVDILLGWALAGVVLFALNRYEARQTRACGSEPAVAGVDPVPDPDLEVADPSRS
ncbi:phosphatase PAP2 family protein [Mycolicibacterium nivoides]|uniref:Phosphatase PAP2 family protein n=1 Tax=Mycolicibacterium nivoides TaxID=2487344 RepID=A0ABW9LG66_9MYCO|nr:phosphatase PAP2 family protein [Mycolicibacterium septicum]QRY48308.1 phosphatase PAP2 family protein [Mycolicibacterium boenickei]SEP90952.1 PAP2 superfamily protein [Mycobacterium sp. 88mf]SFF23296.1 PAP2 superfamily protein [Mycobacterium sp. 455mf]